jgi:CRISPR-associated protein Csx10
MIEVELTIRTDSPLALRANRAARQFAPGLRHVPGTTLRGALAARYLRTGQADQDFAALFLDEQVLFPDLYPVPRDPQRQPGLETARPLPTTARACKRYGAGHLDSLTDSLLRLELVHVAREKGLRLRQDERWKAWERCPTCHQADVQNDRDRLAGSYVGPEDFKKVDTHLRLITGTSINRATGTVEEAQLFSFDALEEGQFFRGRLRLQDEIAEDLLTQLKELAPAGGTLRLGLGKSRGFGRVQVAGWREPRETLTSLEARWTKLNQAVQRLWREFQAGEPLDEYFSLTLESGLIRRDGLLRPQTGISTAAELELPEAVERCRCALNTFTVQGWNAALGLPKADTPALGPGSVLLYRLVDSTQKEAVIARLKEIEREGMGERRAEGFGRVRVCDPFHYHWTLREVKE